MLSLALLHLEMLAFLSLMWLRMTCARKSQGFLRIGAKSLFVKMEDVKVWVESCNPEVLVAIETWFRNSTSYPESSIPGYDLFRQDRSSKGGDLAPKGTSNAQLP